MVIAPPDLIPSTQSKSDGDRIIFHLSRAPATLPLSHLSRCLPQRSIIHPTTQAGHRPSRDPDAAIAQGGGAQIRNGALPSDPKIRNPTPQN